MSLAGLYTNATAVMEQGGKTLEVLLEKLGATHPTFMSSSSHRYNYQLPAQCQISQSQTVAVQW